MLAFDTCPKSRISSLFVCLFFASVFFVLLLFFGGGGSTLFFQYEQEPDRLMVGLPLDRGVPELLLPQHLGVSFSGPPQIVSALSFPF